MIPVYVKQIKEALYNKCYFPALALALTLPDMCGMVEYPKEDVGKRYINLIDKYLGECFSNKCSNVENTPSLTGEVIYNLRNTFLHQGSPSVQRDKIKEEKDKVDKFVLLIGDEPIIWDASINIVAPSMKELELKAIFVDVTHLCNCICDCALWYFENNKEKFSFDFNVFHQPDVNNSSTTDKGLSDPEFYEDLFNRRLKNIGSTLKVKEVPGSTQIKIEKKEVNLKFSNESD